MDLIMDNLIGIAVLITVLYNLTILVYCINEGFKDLCNKNISHKKVNNESIKTREFRICIDTSKNTFYLYTEKKWLNEKDIKDYYDIISKCRSSKYII